MSDAPNRYIYIYIYIWPTAFDQEVYTIFIIYDIYIICTCISHCGNFLFNSEHVHVHVQCILCLKRHTGITSITIDLHVNLNQTVRSIFTVLEQALELLSCFMASFQQCNIRHSNCQVINRIYTLSNVRPLGVGILQKNVYFFD